MPKMVESLMDLWMSLGYLETFFYVKNKNNTVVYISNCSQVSVLTAKHNPLLVTVRKAHGKLHSVK